MGIVKNYTDEFGENIPASYWKVVRLHLEKDKGGKITFLGYNSLDQRGKRVIGSKEYNFTADDYATFFSPAVVDPANVDQWEQCYRLAYAKSDADGHSFFYGATNSDTNQPVTTV